MTKGEYIQNRIDECTNNAIKAMKVCDEKMVSFHLNAKKGFEIKREKMTLEELREEM